MVRKKTAHSKIDSSVDKASEFLESHSISDAILVGGEYETPGIANIKPFLFSLLFMEGFIALPINPLNFLVPTGLLYFSGVHEALHYFSTGENHRGLAPIEIKSTRNSVESPDMRELQPQF